MIRKLLLCSVVLLACLSVAQVTHLHAQAPLDGRNRTFHDEFLENLVGDWNIARKIRGQSVNTGAKAEWVLNHQFLLVHMKDGSIPRTISSIGHRLQSQRMKS